MNAAVPLGRDDIVADLLRALGPHLEMTHRITGFAQGMAEAIGGEPRTELSHLIAEHESGNRLVRVFHRALTTPPTRSGGADGN
ncbi:hypothetical protein AB0B25_07665 [Nocardia sp. NPDC049190]|uniref:hypothetical protein n=1 Tax=Nocardia sp. NPDC049190 TaxID=3155650 RepID=UPI0033E03FE0